MAANRTLETFSSPSSPSSRRWSYDVFLSFRGKDTRKKFTRQLYVALKDAGINTFWDNKEVRRGEDISTALPNAIQESRISIVVFSKNFAASRWCLNELVKIIECRKISWQLVLPIFYDVDPSDVRNQTGSFGKAFAKQEERYMSDMDKVARWRTALTKAGNLAGFHATADSTLTIDFIVNTVSEFINKKVNHLESLYENMNKLKRKYEELNCRKEDVESKMKAELQGYRLKKYAELWLAKVERINGEKQSIEDEVEEGKFSKCVRLGEHVAEKIQEVEELHHKGSSFDGLVVDAPPGNERMILTTLPGTVKREMDEIRACFRNDDVKNIAVYGIGGIGNTTITNSFKNITSLHCGIVNPKP